MLDTHTLFVAGPQTLMHDMCRSVAALVLLLNDKLSTPTKYLRSAAAEEENEDEENEEEGGEVVT